MARKNIITILLVIVALLVVSGCQESSRIDRARSRWQRTIDQARLEAAEKSLDAGQTAYAERLLADCRYDADPDSPLARRFNQLRARIQVEHHSYASTDKQAEDIPY